MSIAIWAVQVVLALAFLATGGTKVLRPRLALREMMPYTEDLSNAQVKAVGGLELLAAAGLILPSVLNVAPVLSPAAAGGLILLMMGAIALHIRRGETDSRLLVNVLLLVLAAAVAWARLGPYKI